jgi:hypothetical protein
MGRARIIAFLILCALLLPGAQAGAQAQERPRLHVLFLGNSLTAANDLPQLVAAIGARSGRVDIDYESVTPGGVNLEDHWNFTSGREALERGGWDVVVMQQGPSALPESQVDLKTWASRFADEIRRRGGRPALFAVWPETERSYAFTTVAASYRNAARASNCELYPAGTAWKAAWRRNPKLKLWGPDGFHPSPLGSYLAAIVVYGGLTKSLPARLPTSLDAGSVRIRISARTERVLRLAAIEALHRETSPDARPRV